MNILERMKERVEKTRENLDQDKAHRAKEVARNEVLLANATAPTYKLDAAYCDTCKRDCNTTLRKHGNDLLAYYQGKCPEGHTVRRELTLSDRYFNKSPLVRRMRHTHANDLLTPNDNAFRYVYPTQWAEYERQREWRDTTHGTT